MCHWLIKFLMYQQDFGERIVLALLVNGILVSLASLFPLLMFDQYLTAPNNGALD